MMSIIREYTCPKIYDRTALYNVQSSVNNIWSNDSSGKFVHQAWESLCDLDDKLKMLPENDVAPELADVFLTATAKDFDDAQKCKHMLKMKEESELYCDYESLTMPYTTLSTDKNAKKGLEFGHVCSWNQNRVFDHSASFAASPLNLVTPTKPPGVSKTRYKLKNSNVLMLTPHQASDIMEQYDATFRKSVPNLPTSCIPLAQHFERKYKKKITLSTLTRQIPLMMDEQERTPEFLDILNRLCSFPIRSLWAEDDDPIHPRLPDDSVIAYNRSRMSTQRLPCRPIVASLAHLCFQQLLETEVDVVSPDPDTGNHCETFYPVACPSSWAPTGMIQPFLQLRCGNITRHLLSGDDPSLPMSTTTTASELSVATTDATSASETNFCNNSAKVYGGYAPDEALDDDYLSWMPADDEDEGPSPSDAADPVLVASSISASSTLSGMSLVDHLGPEALFFSYAHVEGGAGGGVGEEKDGEKPQIAQLLPSNTGVWDVQELEGFQVHSPGELVDGHRAGQDILRLLSKTDVTLNPEVSSFVPGRMRDTDIQGDIADGEKTSAAEADKPAEAGMADGRQPIRPLMEKLVDPVPPCSLLPTGQSSPRYILLSRSIMTPPPRPDPPQPRYVVAPTPSQAWRPRAPPPQQPRPAAAPSWSGYVPVSQPYVYSPTPTEANTNVYYQAGHVFYQQAEGRTNVPPPNYTPPPPPPPPPQPSQPAHDQQLVPTSRPPPNMPTGSNSNNNNPPTLALLQVPYLVIPPHLLENASLKLARM